MKQSKLLKTAVVCIFAALLAVGGAAQLGTSIVCVGPDGHIAIELLLGHCCLSSAAPDDADGSSVLLSSRSCGDCVDVQFGMPPLKTIEVQLSTPDILVEGWTLPPKRLEAGGTDLHDAPGQPMDEVPQSIATLSTIVLLV